MRGCLQTEGMDVLQHGYDVNRHFNELFDLITDDVPTSNEWRLPEWIHHPLVKQAMSIDLIQAVMIDLYQIYHDCGKPMCLMVDEDGKRHYPDHAAVSKARWLECSDRSDAALYVARLIGKDMLVHTSKPADAEALSHDPDIMILLLTALSELHSNAQMFGGIESTSFKIKWKNLNKLGGKIIDAIVAQRQSTDF